MKVKTQETNGCLEHLARSGVPSIYVPEEKVAPARCSNHHPLRVKGHRSYTIWTKHGMLDASPRPHVPNSKFSCIPAQDQISPARVTRENWLLILSASLDHFTGLKKNAETVETAGYKEMRCQTMKS